jgi:hypothetical protein
VIFVLAHAGHWLSSVLYLAPVLILAGALFLGARGKEPDEPEADAAARREPRR